MTPEERAEAIRKYGYREPVGDWYMAMVVITVTFSLVVIGAFGVVVGPTAGHRLRAGLMLAVGIGPAIWGWQFFNRPVIPDNDDDFERELRYRRSDADQAVARPESTRIDHALMWPVIVVCGLLGVLALVFGEKSIGLGSLFLAGAIGFYWWQERDELRRWDNDHRD